MLRLIFFFNNLNFMKGIYKIDFPNKKSYIGQSIDLDRRMNEYKNWKDHCINQTVLYRAFNKYGYNSVHISYLYSNNNYTVEELNTLEIQSIKKFNTLVPNGYSIMPGGKSISGYKQYPLIFNDINEDLEQPIIYTITNKIYNSVIDWYFSIKQLKQDNIYDLYTLNKRYKFVYPELIYLKFGDWFPNGNYTLQDVIDKKVIQCSCLPKQ